MTPRSMANVPSVPRRRTDRPSAAAVLLAVTVVIVSRETTRGLAAAPTTSPSDDEDPVVVDLEAGVGSPFSLAESLDKPTAARVMKGRWLLVFYHHDCTACKREVPKFIRMAKNGPADRPQTAFIEVPPLADTGHALVPPGDQYVSGRLDARRCWFVPMLTRCWLDDGKIVRAESGKEVSDSR